MFEDVPDPNSYEENMRRNSQETREYFGVWLSLLGLLCLIVGILGLWNSNFSPFEPATRETQLSIMVFGSGWIAGGLLIFLGHSWACWMIQIQNFLSLAAIVYKQEWEVFWIVVILVPLAIRLERVRKLLYEAAPTLN